MVIFGASGDLTRRKLVPALHSLYCKGRLPPGLRVVGLARSDFTHEEFRAHLREGMEELARDKFNPDKWGAFSELLWYVPGNLNDPGAYGRLHDMFDLPPDYLTPNLLSLCIQPDEGVHLTFETKVPDSVQETRSVDMEFHYRSSFQGKALPDAYERLLLDALQGDAALFTRSDGIEAAWSLIDPVIEGWQGSPEAPPLLPYEPGGWGPAEADDLLARDGRTWRLGCLHEEG